MPIRVILTVLVSIRRPNLIVSGTKNLVLGSRLYKMGEGSWTLRNVHCYFMIADVMCPAASSTLYVDFPAMMDYTSICKSESTAHSLSYVAFFPSSLSG